MNRILGILAVTLLAFGLASCKGEDEGGGGAGGGSSGPEISVSRGAAIADAGTDNLGSTPFGVAQTLTYTIDNTGGSALNLTGAPVVVFAAVLNCTGSVTTQATTPVALAGNTTFVISLTVMAGGAFSATVSIANDDSNENPYNFTISGTGATVPDIDVQRPAGTSKPDGSTDAVGVIALGVNPPIVWTIANTGTAALSLTGATPVTTSNAVGCSVVVTQPAVSSVPAAGSTTFSLTITTTLATWSFDLDVASGDADENPYDLTISGTASAVGVLAVSTERADIAAASTTPLGTLLQNTAVAIPVILRNTGGAALTLGTVTTSGATNCVATVRDQPPGTLAVNESSTMVLLLNTQTTGAISFTVNIPNSSAVPTFSFTLTATHCAPTRVLYIQTVTNAPNLRAASFPGTASPTTISGAPGVSAAGVGSYFHLNDRAVYTEQLTFGGPTHLYLVGIPPALPAAPVAITTATHVGTTGGVTAVAFTRGDNLVFIANNNSGPAEVWTVTINGTTVGTPVKISGTVTAGQGAFTLHPSPRGDMVAFMGQFDTAGVNELYVASTDGTTLPRTKLNAALSGGRTVVFNSLRWLPDQRGILYEEDASSSSPRHLFFSRAGAAPAPTRINPVPTSGIGVRNTIGFTSVNHVQVSRTSDRVFFLFNDLSGGRNDVFMATIPLTGSPSIGVTCTGSVSGVTNGVTGFRINLSGDRMVSVIDTGAGTPAANELYSTSVSGSTPTTTRIVQVSAINKQGVMLDDNRAHISTSRFWFTNDDLSNMRQELFFTDVSGAAATTRLPGSGAFPGGSTGVILSGVLPHPDGARIVFTTNQNGAGGNFSIMVSTVSATPTVTQISNATAGGPGLLTLSGERIAFSKNNGSAPDNLFTNLLSGTTASEVQISGSEMGTGAGAGGFYSNPFVIFSTGRIFYRFFNNNAGQIEGIANANTTPAIVRDTIVLNPNLANLDPPFKLGHEPR